MRAAGFFLLLLLWSSCSVQHRLNRQLESAEAKTGHHVGFALFDLEKSSMIHGYQEDKYFTPASNVKVLTMYASIKYLGDSLPFIEYTESKDELMVRPLGDPTFLYQEFPRQRTLERLQELRGQRQLRIVNAKPITRFGPGWSWDDYPEDYSAERSSFPIYGNLVTFSKSGSIKLVPGRFPFVRDSSHSTRKEHLNEFTIFHGDRFPVRIPFLTSPELTGQLLADTLKATVVTSPDSLPGKGRVMHSIPRDSAVQIMMQLSDNFVAEQLLLQVGWNLHGELDQRGAIDYLQREDFSALPDRIRWVDGSGLSRYNLVTPRSMVEVWRKILQLRNRESVIPLLASGQVQGTLRGRYKAREPFVFGKTGTLSNNHCLSGLLKGRSGRYYLFSYMNSNYVVGNEVIRKQMEEILNFIYEHY